MSEKMAESIELVGLAVITAVTMYAIVALSVAI